MDIPLFQALTRAGVPDEHAKATTEAIRTEIKQQVTDRTGHLATREDLAELKCSMQADYLATREDFAKLNQTVQTDMSAFRLEMAETRRSLQADMQALRADLIDRMASMHRWMLGTTLSLSALMLAAMRIWPPH